MPSIFPYELILLFSNGLSDDGKEFKKLAEEYAFFKHLQPISKLFSQCKLEVIQKYDIKAFKGGYFYEPKNQEETFLGQKREKIK